MASIVILAIRLCLKIFQIDKEAFLKSLARSMAIDLLTVAHRERGILKYREHESGEPFFAREILARELSNDATIFDVGANIGNYARLVHSHLPTAKIFCFEPNPIIASELHARVSGYAEVHVCAVGADCQPITLYCEPDQTYSEHGSVYQLALSDLHHYKELSATEVMQTSLDSFAKRRNINVIDFVKIDTEGHELSAIKGCGELLARNAIPLIQFEFNEMNVISRVFLRDFFETLRNFDFYRLDTDALRPLRYSTREEIFQFQNIVCACRDHDIAARLRIRFDS